MASTWTLKLKEHAGAHGDLVKNVFDLVGDFQRPLAA